MRLQNLLVATLQTVTLGLLAREQRRFAGKHYTHYQGWILITGISVRRRPNLEQFQYYVHPIYMYVSSATFCPKCIPFKIFVCTYSFSYALYVTQQASFFHPPTSFGAHTCYGCPMYAFFSLLSIPPCLSTGFSATYSHWTSVYVILLLHCETQRFTATQNRTWNNSVWSLPRSLLSKNLKMFIRMQVKLMKLSVYSELGLKTLKKCSKLLKQILH